MPMNPCRAAACNLTSTFQGGGRSALQLACAFLGLFLINMTGSAFGQGTIVFSNVGMNGDVRVFDDAWTSSVPLNQDINFQLEIFSPGGEQLFLERNWLLSDGTANGINVAHGRFADPSHSVIVIPGVAAGAGMSVSVSAWIGPYNSVAEAEIARGAVGHIGFAMVAGSVDVPFASLQGMPQLNLYPLPESRTLGLGAIGLTALVGLRLFHRPRNRHRVQEAFFSDA
jgi:hypothetical protein